MASTEEPRFSLWKATLAIRAFDPSASRIPINVDSSNIFKRYGWDLKLKRLFHSDDSFEPRLLVLQRSNFVLQVIAHADPPAVIIIRVVVILAAIGSAAR
jgi:hypothetical protein